MKLIKFLLRALLFAILAAILGALFWYFISTKDTALQPEKLVISPNNVTLYDNKNCTLDNLSSKTLHQSTSLANVPMHTRNAFIFTEDKRFYSHNGFDYRRIAKAALNNLKTRSFEQGASTISQQLIKNTHLSHEKTLTRKLREWKLTRALERRYSKDEILEKYLNVIYFGHNCFGIRAAARFYFDKEPSELDIADSAILAGLVKSPNNYSPFKNPENCKRRKHTVLNAMLKNNAISNDELYAALDKPLPVYTAHKKSGSSYLRFVFDELTSLSDKYAFTVGGNMQIYTYLDSNVQNELEQLAAEYDASDKTFLVADGATGGFRACVSSTGEIKRSPGSLIKPLFVYAPALEEDVISPATPILDQKVDYGGYSPRNYDGTYHGYVSARECLSKSLNIPAVKILDSMGISKAVSYMEQMELHTQKDEHSLALALGATKHGFSLPQLLSAYGTLQTGEFINGGFISEIRRDGITLYKHSNKKTRVFSEETAYLTTDMLKTAATQGTAKKLRNLPFEIAAKTGTVGTQKGNTDAYALSYTTRDIAGVWLGNRDNSFISCTGGGTPCNLLLRINEILYRNHVQQNENILPFSKPETVVCAALDKYSYYDTHTIQLADELAPTEYTFQEYFKKDALPLKKSRIFSNPTIITPRIDYKNGQVSIQLSDNAPPFYRYKIQRYDTDYASHTTVYFGEYTPVFTDSSTERNKRYVYTVTPVYNGTEGSPYVLPTISTKHGASLPIVDENITQKDWWLP